MSEEQAKPKTAVQQLAEKRASREAGRSKREEERALQGLKDEEALDKAIAEYGDEDVDITVLYVNVASGPGLIIARAPGEYELKQYRHLVKEGRKDGRNRPIEPDPIKAAEGIADACVVYPAGEELDRMYAMRPAVKAQIGRDAVGLTTGRKEAVGKE